MANFFERLFGRATASSANAAKERLQLVLIHDRIEWSCVNDDEHAPIPR